MKIYFVFPYRGVGGVPLLFLRLAQEIAESSVHDCILVDYTDGYMSQRADLDLVNVLPYSDNSLCNIPGDGVVVFQAMTPWSIFSQLRIQSESRVLFWSCHPSNLGVRFPGINRIAFSSNIFIIKVTDLLLRGYKDQIAKFSRYLITNNGLVFMDEPNLLGAIKNSGITTDSPCYLPIPASGSHPNHYVSKDFTKVINFCWVGRIVDFKFSILMRLIDDLAVISARGSPKIILTVVGSGSHLGKLINFSKKIESVPINFIEHLEEKDLNTFLINNVDVLAAMGTSALEGAKFGIPTILLDFSYKTVPSTYTYNWLFKKKGFSLGDDLTELTIKGDSVSSLAGIIEDLCSDYVAISASTHSYFNANHSIDTIAKKLINALLKTSVNWGELQNRGLVKTGILYPLFSFFKRYLAK